MKPQEEFCQWLSEQAGKLNLDLADGMGDNRKIMKTGRTEAEYNLYSRSDRYSAPSA